MDETFSVDISPACSRWAVNQYSFIFTPQGECGGVKGLSLGESLNLSFNYTFKNADSFKEISNETRC